MRPVPARVFAELVKNLGPSRSAWTIVAILVLSVVLATSSHPGGTLVFALGGLTVAVFGYVACGVLIVLNSRIRWTGDRIEYRDMFRRKRTCPDGAVTQLNLRRIKLMNLNLGVLSFLGSGGTCPLAGYGNYWPPDRIAALAQAAGAQLESSWATIPLSAPELSPVGSLPMSLRSPQTVQAILGCAFVGLIVIGVFLFDH